MIAVKTAPAKSPRTGLENMVNILVNSGTSASGFTAAPIVSIPAIRIAKPRKITARSRFFSLLENIKRIIPINASTGANEDGFNIFTKKLPPEIPVRLNSHDVTVVPIFAPIITPAAWDNLIIPEFTSPTTITVVAEED